MVILRPIFDRRTEPSWQASYRGHHARGRTREEAMEALKKLLEEVKLTLPLEKVSGKGQIRVAINPHGSDASVASAAENLPLVAFGPTNDEAVTNLREMSRILGVDCPEGIYDVHATIKGWMN
mgnify:FL=1